MYNKSDISYLKTSWAFDILILHSNQTVLVSDSVGTTSSCLLLAFPLSASLASTLLLLLGIHREVVTVVEYA